MAPKTTAADLAPHGYEADGVTPKAPYGYRKDGVPRKSNRGARPGSFGGGPSSTSKASKTDAKRVESLVMLAEIFICTPLAAASKNRFVKRYLGDKHTDALAGDALILSMHAEITARGMVEYATDHPGLLSWMDGVEEKASSLTLLYALVHPGLLSWMDGVEEKASSLTLLYALGQIGKAVTMNHVNPDPAVAEAGRNMVRMRTVQAAQAAQAEAARYGLVADDDEDQEHEDLGEQLGAAA